LQLHELRFAEGSPIGRAEEKEHRSVRPFQRIARDFVPELIWRSKAWHFLADADTNGRCSFFPWFLRRKTKCQETGGN
jgi:hypothetical protein